MYILTLKGNTDVAYTIVNDQNEKVLLIFENEDDAERYSIMLNENDYPQVKIVTYRDDILLKTCEAVNQKYSIIGPYDLIVPPDVY